MVGMRLILCLPLAAYVHSQIESRDHDRHNDREDNCGEEEEDLRPKDAIRVSPKSHRAIGHERVIGDTSHLWSRKG